VATRSSYFAEHTNASVWGKGRGGGTASQPGKEKKETSILEKGRGGRKRIKDGNAIHRREMIGLNEEKQFPKKYFSIRKKRDFLSRKK